MLFQVAKFHLRIDDLHHVLVFDKLHDLLHPGLQQLLVVAHQGDAHLGLLPQVVVPHFGDGGVELVPRLFDQAFQDLALALQGVVLRDNQGQAGRGDDHFRLPKQEERPLPYSSFWALVLRASNTAFTFSCT